MADVRRRRIEIEIEIEESGLENSANVSVNG